MFINSGKPGFKSLCDALGVAAPAHASLSSASSSAVRACVFRVSAATLSPSLSALQRAQTGSPAARAPKAAWSVTPLLRGQHASRRRSGVPNARMLSPLIENAMEGVRCRCCCCCSACAVCTGDALPPTLLSQVADSPAAQLLGSAAADAGGALASPLVLGEQPGAAAAPAAGQHEVRV